MFVEPSPIKSLVQILIEEEQVVLQSPFGDVVAEFFDEDDEEEEEVNGSANLN